MPDFCKICGKDQILVGYRHNCTPPEHPYDRPAALKSEGEPMRDTEAELEAHVVAIEKAAYKRYKDPEKRKAYMRSYMAKRRAKP